MSTRENGIKLLNNLLEAHGTIYVLVPSLIGADWLDTAKSKWVELEMEMGVSFAYKMLFHLPAGNVNLDLFEMIVIGRQFYRLVEPKRPDDFALGLRMILLSRRPADNGEK
ncbi:MAG: hypothetical protein R6X32_06020 [Chloroflexota bacterium]